MGTRISMLRGDLEAAFAHLADDTVDAADLTDGYFSAIGEHCHVDTDDAGFGAEVPVTPADMIERLDTIDVDAAPASRDWAVVHIVGLADGRVCAFGATSRCGDGCCDTGIWHVAEHRAALPATYL